MPRKGWGLVIERAAEIVSEYDTAVTLRQVHYRLAVEAEHTVSGYANTESDYKSLSRLTAERRRGGSFPPLLDGTRGVSWTGGFASPSEAPAVWGA